MWVSTVFMRVTENLVATTSAEPTRSLVAPLLRRSDQGWLIRPPHRPVDDPLAKTISAYGHGRPVITGCRSAAIGTADGRQNTTAAMASSLGTLISHEDMYGRLLSGLPIR